MRQRGLSRGSKLNRGRRSTVSVVGLIVMVLGYVVVRQLDWPLWVMLPVAVLAFGVSFLVPWLTGRLRSRS